MGYPTDNGRAYIAGWIIKMLAAAFLTASLAWAQHVTAVTNTLTTAQAVQASQLQNNKEQLDRIEGKVDKLLIVQEPHASK